MTIFWHDSCQKKILDTKTCLLLLVIRQVKHRHLYMEFSRLSLSLHFSLLSLFTAAFVPALWKSCTRITSRSTAIYMIRY